MCTIHSKKKINKNLKKKKKMALAALLLTCVFGIYNEVHKFQRTWIPEILKFAVTF